MPFVFLFPSFLCLSFGGDFRGGFAPSSSVFLLPLSRGGLFLGVVANHVGRD
nr:MAG TPA: hypothetical protein [Caudoviricetes sp.]